MSTLSRSIETLPYELGKVAIYKDCKKAAQSHIQFWNDPQRSDNGFTASQRASFIATAEKTIIRCDNMIEEWTRKYNNPTYVVALAA